MKNNKIKKTATSDWMDIEKQRGISVSTSVMEFDYAPEEGGIEYKVNILDTLVTRTLPKTPTARSQPLIRPLSSSTEPKVWRHRHAS